MKGVEMNHELGKSYTLITLGINTEEFRQTFRLIFERDYDTVQDNDTYAFVTGEGGTYVQPLYKGQQAYVMTSEGSTFSNLTFKS